MFILNNGPSEPQNYEVSRADSIVSRLEKRWRETPDDIAVRFYADDATPPSHAQCDAWNWRELRNRSKLVARELLNTGLVIPGSRVLVVYPPGLGFVAAFLGCLYSGVVPVPVPAPRRTEGISRWLHIARDAGISGIMCSTELVETLRPLQLAFGHGFCVAPAGAETSQACGPIDESWHFFTPEAKHIAFLQYTSGSTSDPKGVMVTHGNLMANLAQLAHVFNYGPNDRSACWLPHYHDMGLIDGLLGPVFNGFPVSLMAPASFLRRPLRFLELASLARATVIGGPNFAYQHCVDKFTKEAAAGLDLSCLRIAYNGAEPVRPQTLRQFAVTFEPYGFRWSAFFCCYGQAEATLFQSGNRPDEPPIIFPARREDLAVRGVAVRSVAENDPQQTLELASCGRPAKDLELALVDPEALKRVEEGTVGEIWIRGPNVTPGYWGRTRQNTETFDQVLDGTRGWRRTGDLAFMLDDQLYINGRLKDLIVIRGKNYFPEDIEQTVFSCHPALAQGRAGVFAIEIDGAEEVGVVCELTRAGMRDLDEENVLRAIRGAVSRNHNLKLAVVALIRPGNLPRTPSGKVRRFACREGIVTNDLRIVTRWDARPDPVFAAPASVSHASWSDQLRQTPRPMRKETLRRFLREEIALLSRLGPNELPDGLTGFFGLGLDSLALVNFGATVERELEVPINQMLIFEYPTINDLTDHLFGLIGAGDPSASGSIAKMSPENSLKSADQGGNVSEELEALRALLRVETDTPEAIGHEQTDGDDAER
ncbi:AMP-binding protein [Agrobacterium vitis]|uniref:AMP-binding protein n=1 Tax=Rhizobium/Agrobacterium group TaxID=227290 RepID=UPI0013224DB3|nr:AMP-binding protein [Allorhizobium ampelinum]MVA45793.1 AMP-binding protein [Agrobacterium vitis]